MVAALELPAAARVDRRIPKTLLGEHGAPTAADKRRINEGIEQIQWVAALKPTTIGVGAYHDAAREYLEIAVIRVTFRGEGKADRLLELLHRAIPYPVLAVADADGRTQVSVAHKRWSQSEAGKTVLDGDPITVDAPRESAAHRSDFAAALAVSRQPRTSLLALYHGWLDALLALDAARLSGRYSILPTQEGRQARWTALHEILRLDAEIARLRAAAAKEKQMARQVALNLELKRAEAERAEALGRL
ncbi:MAG: DUF4391 domain-containing protein [Gemmatimonas sp.]|nr:DUF4391 domain-containing protein [Gemmatimonas sp.]